MKAVTWVVCGVVVFLVIRPFHTPDQLRKAMNADDVAGIARQLGIVAVEPASIYGAASEEGIVRYEPAYFAQIEPWDRVSILAHEIGHMKRHTRSQILADEYSGRLCRRNGASFLEATHLLRNERSTGRTAFERWSRVVAGGVGWLIG
jgi:hypothetical protein